MLSSTPKWFTWLPLILGLGWSLSSCGQTLFTARGYWEEMAREPYHGLKHKFDKGDSLTDDERRYITGYELFLSDYFLNMSQEERDRFAAQRTTWDNEGKVQSAVEPAGPYQWRAKDRLANGVYGIYYGAAIAAIGEIGAPASVGIPMITGGLWMIGPAINQKKYEGITNETIRASNTGKFLGLIYGAGLGLMVDVNKDENSKIILGFSAAGSIALGEIAFQYEKKNKFSAGHVEMMRHYGILGPWVGVAGVYAAGGTGNTSGGASIIAGGVAGLLIGNQVSRKYAYSRGDVDVTSSLTWISTGVGFSLIAESLKQGSEQHGLYAIPALASVAGTILAQKSVKGIHFTDQQGSTLNLATAGAALIGLGGIAITKSESPAVWIGVPTALSLLTYEVLFHNYKSKNLGLSLRGSIRRKGKYSLSLKVTPESYFFNKQLPARDFTPQQFASLQNPLIKLVVKF